MVNHDSYLWNLQIVNGRICGDISVSRAFGDRRFKTKKYEYDLSFFCLTSGKHVIKFCMITLHV